MLPRRVARAFPFVALACATPPSDSATDVGATSVGAEASETVARRQFRRTSGDRLSAEVPGVLRAELSAEGMRLRTGADELVLVTRALNGLVLDDVVPTLGHCAPTSEVYASTCAPAAEKRHPAMTEWWTSAADGVHQGWTIHRRLESTGLRIEMDVLEGALVEVEEDGQRAWWAGSTGVLWRYEGLVAWDAEGQTLPATMVACDAHLCIDVDASAAVFPVTIDPSATPAFTAETVVESPTSASRIERFATALDSAGDVNGDGYDDLVIGEPDTVTNTGEYGKAFVYYGSATGASSGDHDRIEPDSSASYLYLGASVAGAGDVDGDGYDDVVVSSYGEDSYKGAFYAFYGTSTGIQTSHGARLTASTRTSYDYLGDALGGGGDINGDGYADVMVGAYGDDDMGSLAGAAYIFYGSATGLVRANQDKLTASDGSANHWFGSSVAVVGDLDGDGYGEAAVGAERSGSARKGSVYVYYGSASGIDTSTELRLRGVAHYDEHGSSVAGAGDVDNDGYDDMIVGARYAKVGGYDTGEAYVYYGSATGVVSSNRTNLSATAGASQDAFGGSVDGAGDIDGDGYDDVVIGAERANTAKGLVYVFFGSASGIDLSTESVVKAASRSNYDYFGCAVAGRADVDADGHPDLLVGADGVDKGSESDAGQAYVIHGGCRDDDGDGWCVPDDCDDTDATINPDAASEGVGDGVDEDCDGTEICYADADDDGYIDGTTTVTSTDTDCDDSGEGLATDPTGECDDTDATVNPGASEGVGDELDQDCDGTEVCYVDADGDGYTDGSTTVTSSDTDCTDAGEGLASDPTGECDDADATIHPTASEGVGDEVDQDCDGTEICYADADDDGYTDGSTTVTSTDTDCTDAGEGLATDPTGECDDADATVNPAALEGVGDGLDQNCDGAETCFRDADDDGYTDGFTTLRSSDSDCDDSGEGLAADPTGDCDDTDPTVNPGASEGVGDEVDQDCDGQEVCYADADDDGYTDGATTVTSSDLDCVDPGEALATDPAGECDDTDATVHPGASEGVGDEVDQDCDGTEICYADADDDGHTDGATTLSSPDTDCTDPGEGLASDPVGDCDDTDATVNPSAVEGVGDELDQDCDGQEACFADADDDGYTDGSTTVSSTDADCADPGEGLATDPTGECDDTDATVHPGATDLPDDGIDQDCDGVDTTVPEVDQNTGEGGGDKGGCAAASSPAHLGLALFAAVGLVRRRQRGHQASVSAG